MPTPTKSDRYPPSMLAALEHARAHGKFHIPTAAPKALRLKFYGLKSALAKDGKDAFQELIMVTDETGLIIRNHESDIFSADIAAALKAAGEVTPSNPIDEADAALKRLGF